MGNLESGISKLKSGGLEFEIWNLESEKCTF